MNIVKLGARPRDTGRKAAREVRRQGRVPCVLYGRGSDSIHFSVDGLAMHRLVFTDELHRLQVDLDGRAFDCILKSFDMDPVVGNPIHADFQLLMENELIELNVPLQFVGTAKGQRDGGEVNVIVHELTVSCLPKHIPDSLEVDISDLGVGDVIHVSDLSFENLTMVTPPQQTVVAVTARKVEADVEAQPADAGEAPEQAVADKEASAE